MAESDEILRSIERRLGEAKAEIEALERARSALAVRDAEQRRAPRRAADPKRRKARRRATEVVPAGKLEALLSADGGLTTAALAQRAAGERGQVLTLLREMEAAGQVRREGQRRSTRWHLITDEERIQRRAAELAARSSSATGT